MLISTHQQQSAFENILGKGEIARNEQFLLFPQCFLLKQIIVSPFVHISAIIFLFAAELEEPKIGRLGEGLSSIPIYSNLLDLSHTTGRLAQLVERRTRKHNVLGLYRCGFESPAGQLKSLIVFRMRR